MKTNLIPPAQILLTVKYFFSRLLAIIYGQKYRQIKVSDANMLHLTIKKQKEPPANVTVTH